MGINSGVEWVSGVLSPLESGEILGKYLGLLDVIVEIQTECLLVNGLGKSSENGLVLPQEGSDVLIAWVFEVLDGQDVVRKSVSFVVAQMI